MASAQSYGATDNPAHVPSGVSNGSVLPTVARVPDAPTLPPDATKNKWRAYAEQEVDTAKATSISVANCFLTGFTSAVSFTACYIW